MEWREYFLFYIRLVFGKAGLKLIWTLYSIPACQTYFRIFDTHFNLKNIYSNKNVKSSFLKRDFLFLVASYEKKNLRGGGRVLCTLFEIVNKISLQEN